MRAALASVAISLSCVGCSDVLGLDELVFDLDAGSESNAGDYRSAVLADTPIGYWRFDEPSGPKALDSSGFGHDGAYTGVVLGAAGAIADDAGIELDGTSYVTFGDLFDFAPDQSFSVELWISASSSIPGYSRALSKETYAASNNDGWDLSVFIQTGKAYAKLERWVGGNELCNAGSIGFSPDAYAHVVAVYDQGTAEVTVNGESSGVELCSAADLADTTAAFTVGKPSNSTSEAFIGKLDELAIYDHPLTSAEVTAHYQKGL